MGIEHLACLALRSRARLLGEGFAGGLEGGRDVGADGGPASVDRPGVVAGQLQGGGPSLALEEDAGQPLPALLRSQFFGLFIFLVFFVNGTFLYIPFWRWIGTWIFEEY